MINFLVKSTTPNVQNIITTIKKSNLKRLFNFVLDMDISNFDLKSEIQNMGLYDTYCFNNDNFDNVDEIELFDLFIEIINNKKKVFVKNFDAYNRNETIRSVSEDLDFDNYILNTEFDVDIKNPNINFFATMLEIFEEKDYISLENVDVVKNISVLFNKDSFSINGKEYKFKTVENFIDIVLKNIEIVHFDNDNSEKLFSSYLPSTKLLYFTNENILEKVEIFKENVFNIIKDMTTEEVISLPQEFKTFIAKKEYIPLEEIYKLIKS